MEKVTGVGGIFFKAEDAPKLRDWYRDNLGIDVDPQWGGAMMGDVVWSIFPTTSKHFDKPCMINYRVSDLDAMLAQLRAAGATVDEKVTDDDFGRFGWVTDPEGNRIELWQPAATDK
ncbi:MAG TPA: VOC family protein [Thermoanaerobaculia bacterium]|nr:VOC family protein [Thermoanaerobaculia bacterium]